jgi:hypothetical protein
MTISVAGKGILRHVRPKLLIVRISISQIVLRSTSSIGRSYAVRSKSLCRFHHLSIGILPSKVYAPQSPKPISVNLKHGSTRLS